MADKTFVPTTGAQLWTTSGNWSPSGVPATGDRAIITSGDSTLIITAGSTQAAVVLTEIVIQDTFLGQLNVDVAATLWRVGSPSGATSGNSGAGKIIANNGSNAATVLVYKTGNSVDSTIGYGAFRFTGTNTGNTVNALAGSVDIGTDLSSTKVNALYVQGGNVTVGMNSTTTAVTITGGTLTHNGKSDSSTGSLVQVGGEATTNGTTKFPTITVNVGTAYINHRASSGDSATTVTVNSGGKIDLQGDTRSFQVGTSFTVNPGGSVQTFGSSQITGIAITYGVGTIQASQAS